MISTKMMRSTIAPALPITMAGVWCFFCRLRHASAMTSALSPDRMMLTRMIWARPLQKAGVSSIPMILPVPAPVIAALTPSLRWLEVLVQPLRRGKPDERSQERESHGNRRRLQQDVPGLVVGIAPRCAGAGLAAGRSRAVQGPGGDHARRPGAGRDRRPRAQSPADRYRVLLDLRPHGARRQGRDPERRVGRTGQGPGLADRRR